MKVGIYYRVSTDRQDLDSQVTTIEKWLADLPEAKKPSKVAVYKDEGISGKTTKREGYQQLLRDCHSGKIDTVVVYRLDRFSRNATNAIKTLLTLDEVGVGFISVTQPVLNLGHENPFRRTMLAAFAEIAEIERDTIVARVKAGLAAAKAKGVRLGAPIKATDDKAKKAKALKIQGKSVRQIATELKLSIGTAHNLLKS